MMKLAISNIAWSKEHDQEIYSYLAEKRIEGLEIAPSRIFSEKLYEDLKGAKEFAKALEYHYGLKIPSMQSIWFGRKENLFADREQRNVLVEYTKKAILFAEEISCSNLVFGCPKNRILNPQLSKKENEEIAVEFFSIIADFASVHNAVIALEANHTSYGTDFINFTKEAIDFVEKVNKKGLRVNLDTGNMLQTSEKTDIIKGNVKWIHHVHFSEPGLELLQAREIHQAILKILKAEEYQNFVSIEMKNQENIENVKQSMELLIHHTEEFKNVRKKIDRK